MLKIAPALVLAFAGFGVTFSCGEDALKPGVPTLGLVAFYPFIAGAADASGNGHNGALLGSATAVGSLVLGDNAGDALSVPHTVLNGRGDFTVAAWVRIENLRNGSHHLLSGARAAEDNELAWWYRADTNEWVAGLASGSLPFTPNTAVKDGGWHHVALTRSGSSFRMYFDGQALGSAITLNADALTLDSGGLVFGQDQDVVGGGFDALQSWAGSMDNIRIYDRALGAVEVERLRHEAR